MTDTSAADQKRWVGDLFSQLSRMKISLEIYIYTENFLMIKEIESAYLEVCVCVCDRWYFCLSMCVSLYVCMLQRERCLNKGFTPEGASNSEKSFSNSTKNKI